MYGQEHGLVVGRSSRQLSLSLGSLVSGVWSRGKSLAAIRGTVPPEYRGPGPSAVRSYLFPPCAVCDPSPTSHHTWLKHPLSLK